MIDDCSPSGWKVDFAHQVCLWLTSVVCWEGFSVSWPSKSCDRQVFFVKDRGGEGSLGENGYVHIYMADSFYCPPEAATTLFNWLSVQFSSVQSLSRVQLFVTPWITARQASLSITNFQSLLKHMSIESVMPSSHLILCRPLLLLPSNPSQHQGLFQWVNSSHEVAKGLEFQLQHQSFQWTPRIDLL